MEINSTKTLGESIKTIKSILHDANRYFYRAQHNPTDVYNEEEEICKYFVEKAFISILVLLNVLHLEDTYKKVDSLYSKAKKEGFNKSKMGIEDPYLIWVGCIYDYIEALASSYNINIKKDVIEMDIISVLRAAQYTITDKKIFASPPLKESDVHLRIEGLLKSIFLDLKHKPHLTKPIKNFEPDTGLPSIKTLIEYKFISKEIEAKKVADEILADTRGYHSRDWERFIYVIYETSRIKPESDWKNLLAECNVEDTDIVVISGEPVTKTRKSSRK